MKEKNIKRVGEVVDAATSEFVTQCYEVNRSPALGTLLRVKNGDIDIIAVLKSVTTSGIEQGRYPLARGKDYAEEADVFKANPQLLKLMRTLFSAQVLGYKQGPAIYQRLPPYPALLHSFVYQCEPAEVQEFAKRYDFLNLLLSRDTGQDQVVVACLRKMSEARQDSHAFLVGAGKRLSQNLSGETERLNYLLRSIRD